MYYVVDLVQRAFEGDIEAIVFLSISFAMAFWWIAHVYILPARQWKPPSGPKERTYFYRKRKVTEEERWPRRSSWGEGGEEGGAGGSPDAGP